MAVCTGLAQDCRWSVMDRRRSPRTHPPSPGNYQRFADAGAGEVAICSRVHISESTSFQWVVSNSGSHRWPWLNSLAHKQKQKQKLNHNLKVGKEFILRM